MNRHAREFYDKPKAFLLTAVQSDRNMGALRKLIEERR
jgi:hypothetical protein